MEINDFQKINWLEPWYFTTPGLEQELIREVSSKHPLYEVNALAVGRRKDNDDVLFFLVDHQPPLALVHLTWGYEDHSERPRTLFYESIQDFTDRRMKVDYLAIKILNDK